MHYLLPKTKVYYCRPSIITFQIFDFFTETAKWNLTKHDWKQEPNALYVSELHECINKIRNSSEAMFHGFQRNLTESHYSKSSPNFFFHFCKVLLYSFFNCEQKR